MKTSTLSQVAQIITNLEHFEVACAELERSLTALRCALPTCITLPPAPFPPPLSFRSALDQYQHQPRRLYLAPPSVVARSTSRPRRPSARPKRAPRRASPPSSTPSSTTFSGSPSTTGRPRRARPRRACTSTSSSTGSRPSSTRCRSATRTRTRRTVPRRRISLNPSWCVPFTPIITPRAED